MMDEYKLMKLIDNIYNRVKYGTMESDEQEDVYDTLLRFADGDFDKENNEEE